MAKSKSDFKDWDDQVSFFLNELFCKIDEKERKKGTRSLTEPERVFLLAYHAIGVLESGGLPYFFHYNIDVEAAAQTYELVGKKLVASLLRKSLSKFPGQCKPNDPDEIDAIADKHEKYFDDLGMKIMEELEDFDQVITAYIAANASQFSVGQEDVKKLCELLGAIKARSSHKK